MIGFVILSHSAKLAEGVCDLAGQVAQGKARFAPAGGTADPENPIGTDAFKALEAIESVYSEDGVIVLADLGSAVLSAETALELLDEHKRARVRLVHGSLVERAVAAASLAGAGAPLEEILRDRPEADSHIEACLAQDVTLSNPLGLHVRPAAKLIRLARGFEAVVTIENVTSGRGPADAAGIHGLLGLDAREGQQLRIAARGPQAREAVAALAAFIESGCGDREITPRTPQVLRHMPGTALHGIPASAGIAIGPLVSLRAAAIETSQRVIEDAEGGCRRLLSAIRGAQEETQALYEWARLNAGEGEAGIFDAQALFLEDSALIESALRIIREKRVNAEFAWQRVAGTFAETLAAREADLRDVAARVLRRLAVDTGLPPVALSRPSVVTAHDLTPSEVKELDPKLVLGLCLEAASAGAHSVILARAMGIPAVVGLGPAIAGLAAGTTVALDGASGAVWIAPGADQAAELERRREDWLETRRAAQAERHRPAATRDGRRIQVLANINGVAGAAEAVEFGAEGVGVLRTEFLFLGRASAPGEDEQFEAYRAIRDALAGRPLVIRVLDVGGDKSLPYIQPSAEANPFLGRRGIRLMLCQRGLLKTQLRAILRAGAPHPIEILLPMVSSLSELREARALQRQAEAELAREGVPFGKDLKMGVMIEVPAAALAAEQLAREAGFFSIGTNDLTQYVMAADRTNAAVAEIADPLQPAVLRLILEVIECGRAAGIGVAVCGELAADPLAAPLLVGFGLEEFSVSAPLIPELKRAIALWTLPEAQATARTAIALDSAQAVREFLAARK
jgi:phosphocarrier protein FPr